MREKIAQPITLKGPDNKLAESSEGKNLTCMNEETGFENNQHAARRYQSHDKAKENSTKQIKANKTHYNKKRKRYQSQSKAKKKANSKEKPRQTR